MCAGIEGEGGVGAWIPEDRRRARDGKEARQSSRHLCRRVLAVDAPKVHDIVIRTDTIPP